MSLYWLDAQPSNTLSASLGTTHQIRVTDMMHPDHFDFIMKIVVAGIAALAASVAAKVGIAAAHMWRE